MILRWTLISASIARGRWDGRWVGGGKHMHTLFRVAMSPKKHQLQAQISLEGLTDVSLALG